LPAPVTGDQIDGGFDKGFFRSLLRKTCHFSPTVDDHVVIPDGNVGCEWFAG
jgi:hypothetical protein